GTSFGNIIPVTDTSLKLNNVPVGESKHVSFELFISEKADLGVYNYKINGALLDSIAVETEKISFEVKDKPEVILSGIDFSVQGSTEKKLFQGSNFSFSVQLDNIGKRKAKAAELKLELEDGFVGTKEAFVGNIDADDSSSALFDLTILPSVKPGVHKATVVVTFLDELDQKITLNKSIDLFVNEKPAESPVALLVVLAVVLGLLYLILRLLLRYFYRNKFKNNNGNSA
ncbi:MAG: CARDB domain-containing protein, partial [Candidatus Diapherotrites archaeon]|nr:CARDB domain-containing protein [Candidatus Diapherotrites archaeon]